MSTSATSTKIPDAVFLPTGCNRGDNSLARALTVCDLADAALAVDASLGEKAYCRIQHTGEFFATKDLSDTIVFPKNHPHEGHPRYNWVGQPNGSRFGYLVERAKKAPVLPVAEVTHAG